MSGRTRGTAASPSGRRRGGPPPQLASSQLALPLNFTQEPEKPAAAAPAASHVYTIPPSAPFLPTLIRALQNGRLIDGFMPGPFDWADVTIFLPTRRACRLAGNAFLPVLGVDAAVLPRIVPIGDIDEDELAFAEIAPGDLAAQALALPPTLVPLERRFLLAHLVRKWAERMQTADGGPALVVRHPAAALALADDLARLLDDMTTREVPWDRLDGLVPDALDQYWQQTLRFLSIAREAWPAILAERGVIEPAARRDRLIAAEAERLAANAGKPVIAAGSTGSMPSTAKLLDAIRGLRHGAVVLPGLDTELDEDSWSAIGGDAAPDGLLLSAPGHPQAAMHRLLARMGLKRSDVRSLADPPPHGREKLMSEALRPAAATDRWRTRLGEIGATIAPALGGITAIAAANAEEEALAIAVVLRESLTRPDHTAALVTPDRALARRVAVMLRRWNIEAEISDGDPLTETPAGVFCRLVAEAVLSGLAPVPLLALLKHPLARFGGRAGGIDRGTAALEHAVLRGPRPAPGSRGLAAAFAAFRREWTKLRNRESSDLHPAEPRASLAPWDLDDAEDLLQRLTHALEPLEATTARDFTAQHFAGLAAAHWEAIRRAGTDGGGEMFAGADGEALAKAFDEITTTVGSPPYAVAAGDYLEVFNAAIAGRMVHRRTVPGAPIRIYGPLEARLTGVDRVILGGLVEGVWPPDPRSDPWLSRPMRAALGLDPPERRIGLNAHDFAQLIGAPEAVLTWPAKRGGAPAVVSRFVQRLAAVAGTAAWEQVAARGERYLALCRRLDAPAGPPRPVTRPAPCPPRAARPTQLSVTEIEHWLRDPYTIYAKHILQLPRLDPVDAPPGGAERGSFIHAAIGDFARTYAEALPPDPYGELIRLGRRHFAHFEDFPEAKAFWWPRYQRIAQWFADFETRRRAAMTAAYAEIRGELTFPAGERTFRLTGRADRIERLIDGAYAVLDFKTGTLPDNPQVRNGAAPQLPLEAAMLRHGGFAGLAPGGSVAELLYVRLHGGNPAGVEQLVKLNGHGIDEFADNSLERLRTLVLRFEDESTPYRPLILSMWKNRYGAYDDLARVKEWSQSGGEEGEE
jgi:ATP-dependent helicase/nuclease subunit B